MRSPPASTPVHSCAIAARAETPLHRAAAFGTEDTIRRLLDAGARRDAEDAYGDTPRSRASWYRRPARVGRPLCYGDFAIHPRCRSLRANRVGEPRPLR